SLKPVLDQAARIGTAVQIRDLAGQVVATSGAFAEADGSQSSLPVVVRGQRVGTALVRSTGSGLAAADRSLKTALLRAIAGAADPTRAELGSLRDEVLRLARMVGDLQTLAAADAAALNLTRSPCDLAELAATAADSLARRFEAAGITLDRKLAASPVLADAHW